MSISGGIWFARSAFSANAANAIWWSDRPLIGNRTAGEPVYEFKSGVIVDTKVAEKLKKKVKRSARKK